MSPTEERRPGVRRLALALRACGWLAALAAVAYGAVLARPAPCVVTSPAMLASWERQLLLREPPLAGWLGERFRLAGDRRTGRLRAVDPAGDSRRPRALGDPRARRSGRPDGSQVLRLTLPEMHGEVLESLVLARAGSAGVLCDSTATPPVPRMTVRDEEAPVEPGADGPRRPVSLDRPPPG